MGVCAISVVPASAINVRIPLSNARWPKVIAAVASGAILAVTAVGAGVTSVLGQLEGNIMLSVHNGTTIEISFPELAG